MIDTQAPAEPDPRRVTRRRLVWAAVVLGVAILVAGTVTGIRTWRHYSAAPPLRCTCAYGWGPVDAAHLRPARFGDSMTMVVPADPTRRQDFYLSIANRSSVTQTVLGLDDNAPAEYRLTLAVSTTLQTYQGSTELTYTDRPVNIPPGGVVGVRLGLRPSCLGPHTELTWRSANLRVRVGWSTRTEHVDFAGATFGITGTRAAASCAR